MDGSGGHITSDLFFRRIPGVLEQLRSPIQKLVFEVSATGYLQLGAIPWASIDRIVDPETPQFRESIEERNPSRTVLDKFASSSALGVSESD